MTMNEIVRGVQRVNGKDWRNQHRSAEQRRHPQVNVAVTQLDQMTQEKRRTGGRKHHRRREPARTGPARLAELVAVFQERRAGPGKGQPPVLPATRHVHAPACCAPPCPLKFGCAGTRGDHPLRGAIACSRRRQKTMPTQPIKCPNRPCLASPAGLPGCCGQGMPRPGKSRFRTAVTSLGADGRPPHDGRRRPAWSSTRTSLRARIQRGKSSL